MDSGSTAFILLAAAMVFLMTPGLAFFYGGLGRRKNVINTMMMSIAPIALAVCLWIICGYSLSFAGQGDFVGNFSHIFFQGVSETESSLGNQISDIAFSAFQMMFSIIAVAIVTGSVAGRMRFTPLLFFMAGWLLLIYYPLAHMVWGGGLLAKIGALDFAGGDVVHISSGVTGLVLALAVGRRRDFQRLDYRPHNIPFVLLGTGLLAFGWFGFNAGSALEANGAAVHAFMTTILSAAAAMFSWLLLEKALIGKPSLVGASTGLIAGLVAITPGAAYVPYWAALLIGLLVSPVCYFAISVLKVKLGYDDALDAFGCHGIGGLYGGLMTALFTSPQLTPEAGNYGLFFGSSHLLLATLAAIALTLVWSALIAWLLIRLIGMFTPLRVSDRAEALGLDDSEHEETAYPTFMGLDS
ncbi:Ammonium transporter [Streptococcus sp. DD11]|uniref:ammonium transporter n=1 Tax=Streptococcus sp. DD11 TaxID=1777879 RepID=UPI00079C30F4|nr:ammonium transporter [Streptococcus sp. DD11]KXT84551.1 Ammonium transporter [Streptococcus sp. DD11]